jgi:hypothetical protein
MRARILRKNEREVFMLVCGILFLELQSRHLRNVHGIWVLLKRFIMEDQGCFSTAIENNVPRVGGTQLSRG